MRAPSCRWLAAAGLSLTLLAAALQLASAGGPVPVVVGAPYGDATSRGRSADGQAADGAALSAASSRLVRADDVAGTYSLVRKTEAAGECLGRLTLGSPSKVRDSKPEDMLLSPGEDITRDGTRCSGGGLLVICTLMLLNAKYINSRGLVDTLPALNTTESMRNWLQWSDLVGVRMDSWACGTSPRWDNAPWALFGDSPWSTKGGGLDGGDNDAPHGRGRPAHGDCQCTLRLVRAPGAQAGSRAVDRARWGGPPHSGDRGHRRCGPRRRRRR